MQSGASELIALSIRGSNIEVMAKTSKLLSTHVIPALLVVRCS